MLAKTKNDPCFLSATEALSLFRAGSLSPVELLKAQLERIEQKDPLINALSAKRIDEAMAQARESEKIWHANPGAAGLLEGIPTLLKNEHSLIGLHTTQGSWLCGEQADEENAPLVQRLLDAGVVIQGQTNVPEFYLAAFTSSPRHGTTRNPWNTSITCGGSSGGSAAALASGMTTLATASDIGGSIRVPSSYCGVVGLKASYGRIPEASFAYAMNVCNHNGAMARTVADCALMFNVIGGPHAVDPATVKPKLTLPNEFGSVKGLRVAISHDLGYFNISADVRQNTARVAHALRDAGAIVEEVDLNWGAWIRDTFTHYLGFLLGIPLSKGIRGYEESTSDYVRYFADFAQHITADQFLATTEQIGRMHSALQAVYESHDVLICPTMANTATPAEGTAKSHDNLLDSALTYPFNLLSRHPILAIPSGLAGNGVPTGVQIVGRTFDEVTVMQVGAAIEHQLPWAYPNMLD